MSVVEQHKGMSDFAKDLAVYMKVFSCSVKVKVKNVDLYSAFSLSLSLKHSDMFR